jgi:predicted dehydrogenase
MTTTLNLAIFGCGDFLRWESKALAASTRVRVAALYDPDRTRAEKWAKELGGRVLASPEEAFADPAIGAVALFVPPQVRRGLVEQAAAAGKAVIATKPLASDEPECAAIAAATAKIPFAVIYGRTGNPTMEALKDLFEAGTLGKLALYKQDWIHHYPQWNSWATDPKANGGPFMDAMIHNLNAACYLMGRTPLRGTLFADSHSHPELACKDTEFLKLDFAGGGSAHLFITWAADLQVWSTAGNEREHIDQFFLVTDQGWRLTLGEGGIHASRKGEKQIFPVPALAITHYDGFAATVLDGAPLPRRLVPIADAARDITIIRRGMASAGKLVAYALCAKGC